MRRITPPPATTVEPTELLEAEDRTPPPGHPWVILNMVTSLDGRVQGANGRSGPLSGPADRALFRALRAQADVVLAGAGTARTENYGPVLLPGDLTERRLAAGRPGRPRLAVVTRALNLAPDRRLFEERGPEDRTIVLTTSSALRDHPAEAAALQGVASVRTAGDTALNWRAAFTDLTQHGPIVLVEGGPAVNGQILAADLVDEICLTLSPRVTGGTGQNLMEGPGLPEHHLELSRVAEDDNYLLLRYVRRR